MSCQRSLVAPMRRLMVPRPAILAWRNSRYFATEVADIESSNPPPTPPMSQANASATSRANASATSQAPITPPSLPQSPIEDSTIQSLIAESASVAAQKDPRSRRPVGVVISSGKMFKTVKVRIPDQRWDKYIRKHFRAHRNHLVHDPSLSLRTGDVISLRPHRAAKHVHHVVHELLVPFGPRIEERPAVPSEQEMLDEYNAYRERKLERRTLRVKAANGDEAAAEALRGMGLDPGVGVGVDAQKAKDKRGKGEGKGMMGAKGQKLGEGVLPGGKHAVGKIDARAKRNREKADKLDVKAEENMDEARERAEELGTDEGSVNEGSPLVRRETVQGGDATRPVAGSVRQD